MLFVFIAFIIEPSILLVKLINQFHVDGNDFISPVEASGPTTEKLSVHVQYKPADNFLCKGIDEIKLVRYRSHGNNNLKGFGEKNVATLN